MHLVSHCSTSVVVVCAFDFAHTHMFGACSNTLQRVHTHTHFIHMQVATTLVQPWERNMEENEKQELAAQVLQLARSEENEIDDTVMQKQQHSNKRLPEPVTIPKTGPLVLKSSSKLRQMYSSSLAPASQRGGGGGGGGGGGVRRFVNPFDSQTLRPKHSLTRFPVVLLQRPIEQIENNLGKISCAELKDNIQLLTVSALYNLF